MSSKSSKSLIILYHFFHPDDVISARLYADIAKWAATQGWSVIAMPSVRSCHDDAARFSTRESFDGYTIHRVWRPAWSQSKTLGRLGNTFCMLLAWTWRALTTPRSLQECVVIGTDPPLGVLAAIPWRWFRRNTKIIHWCHDLYPHAAVAEGMINKESLALRLMNRILGIAYRCCDRIVDLGPCMKNLLAISVDTDPAKAASSLSTITPWALVEPMEIPESDPKTQIELFGQNCSLSLLYSGNLGRAHGFQPFIDLAAKLTDSEIRFCFAGRGPKFSEVSNASTKLANIRLAGFSEESKLTERLAAADIHLVSLQHNWTGCVVPSKFFGALSVGRPVLFSGSNDCAIAQWINTHRVGWVINDESSIESVANELRNLGNNPAQLLELKHRCFEVYHRHFAKKLQLERWGILIDGSSGLLDSTTVTGEISSE